MPICAGAGLIVEHRDEFSFHRWARLEEFTDR